jgi:hypothetical protein
MKLKHISRHHYLIYVCNGTSDSLWNFLSSFQVKAHVLTVMFIHVVPSRLNQIYTNAIKPSLYKVRGMKAK